MSSNTKKKQSFQEYPPDSSTASVYTDQNDSEYNRIKNQYVNPISVGQQNPTFAEEDPENSGLDLYNGQTSDDHKDPRQNVGYRSSEGVTYFDPDDEVSKEPNKDKRWRTSYEKFQWLKKIDDGRVVVDNSQFFRDANTVDYKFFRNLNTVDRNSKKHIRDSSQTVEIVCNKLGFDTTHPVATSAKEQMIDIENTQQDVDGVTGMFQTAIVLVAVEHRRFHRNKTPELSELANKIRTQPLQKVVQETPKETPDDAKEVPYAPLKEIESTDEEDIGERLFDEFDIDQWKMNQAAKSVYGDQYISTSRIEEVYYDGYRTEH